MSFHVRVTILAGTWNKSAKFQFLCNILKDETPLKIQLNEIDAEKEQNSLKNKKNIKLSRSYMSKEKI